MARIQRPSLERVAREARACRVCAASLPHAPRPVFRVGRGAQLMIVGQAPGRRVHESGLPWNDPSGDTLRAWLALDRAAFYDRARIAILPTGFCYPGTVDGGDLPPRPECAPLWHARFRDALPEVRLTLLVGQYAQAHYLGAARKATLAATVQAYRQYLPEYFPLPHPSWRNKAWVRRNAWFEADVIPVLRRLVHKVLR